MKNYKSIIITITLLVAVLLLAGFADQMAIPKTGGKIESVVVQTPEEKADAELEIALERIENSLYTGETLEGKSVEFSDAYDPKTDNSLKFNKSESRRYIPYYTFAEDKQLGRLDRKQKLFYGYNGSLELSDNLHEEPIDHYRSILAGETSVSQEVLSTVDKSYYTRKKDFGCLGIKYNYGAIYGKWNDWEGDVIFEVLKEKGKSSESAKVGGYRQIRVIGEPFESFFKRGDVKKAISESPLDLSKTNAMFLEMFAFLEQPCLLLYDGDQEFIMCMQTEYYRFYDDVYYFPSTFTSSGIEKVYYKNTLYPAKEMILQYMIDWARRTNSVPDWWFLDGERQKLLALGNQE